MKTYNSRITYGWTPKDAMETPAYARQKSKLLTHDGKTMARKDWAAYLGMPGSTFHKKFHKYGLQRLIEMVKSSPRPRMP